MRFDFKKLVSKKYKKPLIITSSVLLSLILIGGSIAFFKREALLKTAVDKAITKSKSKYNLNVTIANYGFSGLSTVQFENVSVVPQDRDRLAFIKNFEVGISIIPLIFGDIKIAELAIENANISLIKKDSLSNYDFLFKKNKEEIKDDKPSIDLSEIANRLIKQALDKIPDEMNINWFLLTYQSDKTNISFLTETATIDNGDVNSTIKVNGNEAIWHILGTANPSDQQLDLSLFADNKKVEFPYLYDKFGLKLNFDTVRTVLTGADQSGDEFEMNGSWSVSNLLINHPRLASNDIIVKRGMIDAKVLIGNNYVALDSSSVVYLGKAEINPFIKYTLRPNKIYEMQLHAFDQDAQAIFEAFPVGLFESLEGIKVQGKLRYDLNFYLNSQKPNDVIFTSSLTKSDDFDIQKFGKTDFKKINSTFIYTPFEKGKPMRDIVVGPGNPNFVPFNQISQNIKNALLTSEDPSFFSHKGFVEESIRQSIATNFKAKSFKRGGSTISMQLVKNVYLNRQKTLARKIEEILIVWLIENQKISSKTRMYEVYLNIIEWGRNVYGIGEAANYYFGKHPSQLNLGEAIYLAHIVPKPKSSLYAWQSDGSLKPYMIKYFNFIGGIMARRGLAINDSSSYGYYGVRLRESLRQQINPSDLLVDSLVEEEESSFFNLNIFKSNKRDSLAKKEATLKRNVNPGPSKSTDTIAKTPKQLRIERRQSRRNDN
jgi:hypothetical protein